VEEMCCSSFGGGEEEVRYTRRGRGEVWMSTVEIKNKRL
jgi:uncharacterized protein (AIM24 family)